MKTVCLSFGENCVTEDILRRYNFSFYTTPYAWARSNIEYILQIEKDHFSDFLNKEYLQYELLIDREKARLKHYHIIENTYNPLHMNGFEFSHHDVIANDEDRNTIKRRYERLLDLKDKAVYAFYYHRHCQETDRSLLMQHLAQLKEFYLKNRCRDIEIIMFTQVIVDAAEKRKVVYHYQNGIHVYEFYTMNVWGGGDLNNQPAECDKDLLKIMIRKVKMNMIMRQIHRTVFRWQFKQAK